MEWMPIETAPRDESIIFLGWDETNGFYSASFDYLFNDGTPRWSTLNWERCRPTHWTALPPSPAP